MDQEGQAADHTLQLEGEEDQNHLVVDRHRVYLAQDDTAVLTCWNFQYPIRHGANSCISEEMVVDQVLEVVRLEDADEEAPEEAAARILGVEENVEDEPKVAPELEQMVVEVLLVERRGLQTLDGKESRHKGLQAAAVVHHASREQTTEQGHLAMENDE